MGMTRKFDPNLGQYRDSGKFDGNDNQPATGGMTALESKPTDLSEKRPNKSPKYKYSDWEQDPNDPMATPGGGRVLAGEAVGVNGFRNLTANRYNRHNQEGHDCNDWTPHMKPGAAWSCRCGKTLQSIQVPGGESGAITEWVQATDREVKSLQRQQEKIERKELRGKIKRSKKMQKKKQKSLRTRPY